MSSVYSIVDAIRAKATSAGITGVYGVTPKLLAACSVCCSYAGGT